MKKICLIIPYDYKLLSIAAILDVFETVNRIYIEGNKEIPFEIHIFQTPDQIKKDGDSFHGYSIASTT
jgi:hypothetical protein